MKTALIIDDQEGSATVLENALNELGIAHERILGNTSSEMLPELQSKLKTKSQKRNSSKSFDATLLDILFHGEQYGGVELWKQLSPEAKAIAGKLIIFSSNAADPVLREFAASEAESRCFSLYPRKTLLGLLKKFILEEQ